MSPASTKIQDLFREAGRQLRAEFQAIKGTNPLPGERGGEAEDIVRRFLNDHLPKRFAADTGLVVDDEGGVSLQCDVIVYDASNSPVYRRGPRVLILPSDNVAAVLEVKSTLNKAELEDAAKKIASVKRLKRSPVTNVDQPATFGSLIMTRTMGVVFAYDAATSLETLGENLSEINGSYPADQWIDMVVVLDKGVIGYAVQIIFSPDFAGWLGGPADETFVVPPFYIHLVNEELGDLTLNRFYLHLMAQLTFYRRRSAVRFDSLLGTEKRQLRTLHAYQYDLERRLKDTEEYHREGVFRGAKVRFNIRNKRQGRLVGQVGWIPWQNGAVVCYSGELPPVFFDSYFEVAQSKGMVMRVPNSPRVVSSVIPLSEGQFIEVTESIHGDFAAERCAESDDDLGWFRRTESPESE